MGSCVMPRPARRTPEQSLSFDQLRERFPRTAERFRVSRYYSYQDTNDIAHKLADFFDVECGYIFHYDDVVKLPKRINSKTVGYYPKLTVKGHPANFEDHWFKTIAEARLHILDLAAYIFEEELRIEAT